MTDSNKHDEGKLRLTLAPTSVIRYIAAVREYGIKKYPDTGEQGWKEVGRERFADALFRHLVDYIEDPSSVDKESGLPTIAHIACNAAFLCFYDELFFGGLNREKNMEENGREYFYAENRIIETSASDSIRIGDNRNGNSSVSFGDELNQSARDSERKK